MLDATPHIQHNHISKWENGLSVPDSEMLIRLAEALDTSVSVILGETVTPDESTNESNEQAEIQRISAKLELLNEQYARQNEANRKHQRIAFHCHHGSNHGAGNIFYSGCGCFSRGGDWNISDEEEVKTI